MSASCPSCGSPNAVALATWVLCANPDCRLFDRMHLESLGLAQVLAVQHYLRAKREKERGW